MSEIEGKARYQVPSRLVRGLKTYYLTPDVERHFRRLYPVTMNRDMMRLFGISHSTMERFKRNLGLQKNMRTIRHKHAQQVKRICEENGYYDSIRGKQPSDACIEAAKRKRASGFHPLKALKQKNPRKYRRVVQQWSEARRELIRKERIRVNWGLGQDTKIRIPYSPYSRKHRNFRYTCQAVGYIPGNANEPAERWKIFYTQDTKRGTIREQHGTALGFKFEPLTTITTNSHSNMEKNRVLDLSLKARWYDMISSGEKKEEYRDFRPYYANRLLYGCNLGAKEYWETIFANAQTKPWFKPDMLLRDYGSRHYDAVRFHRGQGSPVTMLWEYEGLEIGKGKPEWGAPEDKDVFIIKLGKRLTTTQQ